MTSRDFESTYGLELLPYSTEDTQIGDVLSNKGLFHKTLAYLDFTVVDQLDLTVQEKSDLNSELKDIPVVSAQFPDVVLDKESSGFKWFKDTSIKFRFSWENRF